jgi:hypothetical protein
MFVDVVEMHVLDATRRQLEDLDRIGSYQYQLSDVDAERRLRSDQQPLYVGRPLDHAAVARLHREPELVPRADVLHGADQVQEVGPSHARQDYAVLVASVPRGDR